ncbi:ABC transporter substrate-binding protein [Gulosibacter chungangensis]|nr:ABC transporter substrate-binding protein [Gulosibacter chungangensis]
MYQNKVKNRYLAKLVASLGVVALALTGCASGDAASEDAASTDGAGGGELTAVKVGITPAINNATFNLAIDGELGQAHGLDLQRTVVGGAGSSNQVSAMLAGDIDISVGGTNTIADAISQGSDIQIIAGHAPLMNNLTLTTDAMEASGVSLDAPLEERIEALKGLKIAVASAGSTSHTVLVSLLTSYGIDVDNDITLVPINDLGAVPAGLMQGTYDAAFASAETGGVAVSSGDAVTWISLPRGDVPEYADYVGLVLYSSRQFIEENPEIIEGVVATLHDAETMARENPDEAGDILKAGIFSDMEPAVFDDAWSQVHASFHQGEKFTKENWQTIVDLFDEGSENDYSALVYEDIVIEPARG